MPEYYIFPLLTRKSSGFARKLPDFFLPENGYLKNSRGAAAPSSPMGRTPKGCIYLEYRAKSENIFYDVGFLPILPSL